MSSSSCQSFCRLASSLGTPDCHKRRECYRLHTQMRYFFLSRPTNRNILVYRCTPDPQKTAECCPRHILPVMDRIGSQWPTRLCMCRSVYQRLSSLPCTRCFRGRFLLVPERPGTRLGMSTSGVAYRQVIRNVDLSHRNGKVMGKTHVWQFISASPLSETRSPTRLHRVQGYICRQYGVYVAAIHQ
jgi:hypothetical protein